MLRKASTKVFCKSQLAEDRKQKFNNRVIENAAKAENQKTKTLNDYKLILKVLLLC